MFGFLIAVLAGFGTPHIVAEPAVIDVGELVVGSTTTVTVHLRNVGDESASITAAIPNCGCVKADWPSALIAAGSEATATVTITPGPSQLGESLHKTVTYAITGTAPVTVVFTGHVADAISNNAATPPSALPQRTAPATTSEKTTQPAPASAANSNPSAAPIHDPPFMRIEPKIFPGATISFPQFTQWVQGTPIHAFEPKQIYVFEFFSTTCSHCKQYAEVIEQVAHTYGALGVRFISITQEDPATVAAWLEQPAQKNKFTWDVVSDTKSAAMVQMQGGTFHNFTPRSFIVRDGIIEWFGHPKLSADPLKQLLAGTWNSQSIRQEFILDSHVARAKNYLDGIARSCDKSGDWNRLLIAVDNVAAVIPERANNYKLQRFTVMLGLADMPDQAYAYARELALRYHDDVKVMRSLAQVILNSPFVKQRDVKLALQWATEADSLANGQDSRAANTLALACFSNGDRENAIQHEERAVRLEKDAANRADFEQSLVKYRTQNPGPEPTRTRPSASTTPAVIPNATTVPAQNTAEDGG